MTVSISTQWPDNCGSGRRAELAGLIEIRGLGIRRCDFVSEAVVGLVVDLAAGDAERLPPPEALSIRLNGVLLPRIPVGTGYAPPPADCSCADDNRKFRFQSNLWMIV